MLEENARVSERKKKGISVSFYQLGVHTRLRKRFNEEGLTAQTQPNQKRREHVSEPVRERMKHNNITFS